MRRLIFNFLCLHIAICVGAFSVRAQANIGYVLDVEGNWTLNRTNTLTHGERLPAGGSVRLDSASRFGRIVVADLRGEVIISRNCSVDNCSRAFVLPYQPPPKSLWNSAFEIIMKMISSAPSKYSAHRSRSGELNDGVLKMDGAVIDLAPVLSSQGEQYLRWRSMAKGDATAWSQTQRIADRQTISAPGLKPGLYVFELMRRSGLAYETTSSAWLLITDDARYVDAHESFQEAKALIKKWGETVKSQTARSYLLAKLDELALRHLETSADG
jgi:hypothetical protein